MNRTASIRIKGINIQSVLENLPFLLLLFLAVSFVLAGVLSLNNSTYAELSAELFNKYTDIRKESRFLNSYLKVLFTSVKYPLISFLCGTSVLGILFSPFTVCYTGFCYGLLAGYIHINFGITGIVFNIFVLLIPSVIVMLCLIFSAKNCFTFSSRVARLCTKEARPLNLYYEFRFLCLKHLLLLIPLLVSTLIDTSMFMLFQKYLNI